MTEEEAKTKACQMTFNLNHSDKCMASKCMAWRAVSAEDGYCGMAGRDERAIAAAPYPRVDL